MHFTHNNKTQRNDNETKRKGERTEANTALTRATGEADSGEPLP